MPAAKYSLKTQGKDGAQEGKYKVTVAMYESADDADTGEGGELADPDDITDEYPDDYNEAEENEQVDAGSKNQLPAKYASGDTSGLTADVTSGTNEGVDFKLE